MTTVTRQVTVRAPWERAFDVFTRFELFPDFMKSVDNVRPEDGDPGLLHWQVSIASVPRTFTTRVEVLREERIVRWEATQGLAHRGSASFAAEDGEHTVVDFRLEFEPEGALEKAGDALGLVGKRMRADIQNYADFVESHGEETKGRNPVADSLDLNDPAKTPSERLTDQLYPGAR